MWDVENETTKASTGPDIPKAYLRVYVTVPCRNSSATWEEEYSHCALWVIISLNSPVWIKFIRAAIGREWGKTAKSWWQLELGRRQGSWQLVGVMSCILIMPSVVDSTVSPPNLDVEALTPSVTMFGDGVFKEVIKVKWGHKGRAQIQYDWCPYKKKRHQSSLSPPHTQSTCEDTVRRWPSTSQEERPHQKPTLMAPWSRISSLQNWENNVYCLGHPDWVFCHGHLTWLVHPGCNLGTDRSALCPPGSCR